MKKLNRRWSRINKSRYTMGLDVGLKLHDDKLFILFYKNYLLTENEDHYYNDIIVDRTWPMRTFYKVRKFRGE